jgi:DNA-binding IclR family transcriptional regulator
MSVASMYEVVEAEPHTTAPTSMLERVTAILDLFDHAGRRLPLEEISRRTGLPRSSAHRILEHMISLGWACRSDAGYGLGTRARGLGRLTGDSSRLRTAATPVLHELAVATGLVAQLGVLEGANIVYLDKLGGRQAAAVPSRVGDRRPAAESALGQAMLACLKPEQVETQLTAGLRAEAPDAPDYVSLHAELGRVRQRKGVAIERGAGLPGFASVAAPVSSADGCVAAISLITHCTDAVERIVPLVADAARRISRELVRLPRPVPPHHMHACPLKAV